METILGREGDPPQCIERGPVSLHWYPSDAPPGARCLCGMLNAPNEHSVTAYPATTDTEAP